MVEGMCAVLLKTHKFEFLVPSSPAAWASNMASSVFRRFSRFRVVMVAGFGWGLWGGGSTSRPPLAPAPLPPTPPLLSTKLPPPPVRRIVTSLACLTKTRTGTQA